MTSLVSFYLVIDYRASSKEYTFLGEGWGIKDVRGPYLNRAYGNIFIDNVILSPQIPSDVSIILSVSNILLDDTVIAKMSFFGGYISHQINKGQSTEFVIDKVLANSLGGLKIIVELPEIKFYKKSMEFWDIVAIDKLTIERSQ